MLRQASSRNHRNKGFKVKHVLQMCLLLAVCIWLLYQVKHSHDKKKAFDENNAKISGKVDHENLKLGRKDLNDDVGHRAEVASENDKHGEEEDNDNEEEEGGKIEENVDEERGGGDDEIDEQDQEKVDEEAEREEYSGEETKEVKEKDDEEKEEGNEKDGETEDANSAENHDNELDDKNTREAREENYKGDDASSAVIRDNPQIMSVAENEELRLSGEEHVIDEVTNKLEDDNQTNRTQDGSLDEIDSGSRAGEVPPVTKDEQVVNNASINANNDGNESHPNVTTVESPSHEVLPNIATVDSKETLGLYVKNETAILTSVSDQNPTVRLGDSEKKPNLEMVGSGLESSPNSTAIGEDVHIDAQGHSESSNSTSVLEETLAADTSQKVGLEHAENSKTTIAEEVSGDNVASSLTADEVSADTVNDEATHSASSVVTQEMKEALTDLETLPHIESKGGNTEDTAAE